MMRLKICSASFARPTACEESRGRKFLATMLERRPFPPHLFIIIIPYRQYNIENEVLYRH